MSLLLSSQGWRGRGVCGGDSGRLGCPASESPSHWMSLGPPPFSRPEQSRCLFSQTLAKSGGHTPVAWAWPTDASPGAWCLEYVYHKEVGTV